ncbi:hypothetical protein F5B18DRAFT_674116 [Nemania serpens]|nr:hypothetical protein F5B18DRAFT_674116 [Nemania serpens]
MAPRITAPSPPTQNRNPGNKSARNNENSEAKRQKKDSRGAVDNSHCIQHQKQEWNIDKNSWRARCHFHRWCPFKGRPSWVRWTVLVTFVMVVGAVILAGIIFTAYYVSSTVTHFTFSPYD